MTSELLEPVIQNIQAFVSLHRITFYPPNLTHQLYITTVFVPYNSQQLIPTCPSASGCLAFTVGSCNVFVLYLISSCRCKIR